MRKVPRPSRTLLLGLSAVIFFAIFLIGVSGTEADLVDELKAKIDERNVIIRDLEKEIAEYQTAVEKTGAQAKTLKNTIATLELTRKKLTAEISVIQNKIKAANLTITKLDTEIGNTELTIDRTRDGISAIIKRTDEEESNSLVETLLNYQSLSTFLDRLQSLSELSDGLRSALSNLRLMKTELETKQTEAEGKRRELQNLAGNLSDKKKVAEYNKTQTNKLLTDTKSKQSNYQKLLDEKIALRNAFEQELLSYESQLKIAIDPSNLPASGSGVLSWPMDKVKVTQPFGDTAFARSGAYNGKGHNGIDLAAAIGTPVKAALAGRVVGIGNTDTVCPSASYGRWVLLEHANGLSTLYAHLSVVKVSSGQSVSTGELIGYSGDTGYATGPHLHFTVYATQGVQILTRKSAVCKGSYTMPIASLNAYLNPMLYL